MPTAPPTPPTSSQAMPTDAARLRVHRFEVARAPGHADPRADRLLAEARALGYQLDTARSIRIYLIQAPIDKTAAATLGSALLADPVVNAHTQGVEPAQPKAVTVEVHPLPGVMDPTAHSVRDAAAELLSLDRDTIGVSTGWRYDLIGQDAPKAAEIATRLLANPVVNAIHTTPFVPTTLPVGHPAEFRLTHITIRNLDDDALTTLSRDAHLFLSLEEMRTIRDHYQALNREPTDIELETLAQTWSEHCVHKTLKSTIRYRREPGSPGTPIPGLDTPHDSPHTTPRPGHTFHDDGSVTIDSLLKRTVAAATFELIDEGIDWTLSVFKDNAGIIAFDDKTAVCVKVETHNHPSAIEPYGGAATGIGGCIRDIIGTGLAAKPIASTDVFCVAYPDTKDIPPGCLHPKRILSEVVAGVRDYGNRMGIPTLNGSVSFDNRYIGNPLVYCGCVGVMPIDLIDGDAQHGDLIVALGGRTGRDGIHGATFSSAELTDTHADEFSHAVQIGNAIEEKRVLDAILRARDASNGPLFSAITDCGAGGFSSAVGEMGAAIGADVNLDAAPLKYDGLTYTEIWISEAQERMVLAVAPDRLAELQQICDEEHVELAVLGSFGTPNAELILNYQSNEVGRISMHLLHEGIPQPTRQATWSTWDRLPGDANAAPERAPRASEGTPAHQDTSTPATCPPARAEGSTPNPTRALLTLLAHPNIASKHWIIRQYDHEVQGNTILRPLVGPGRKGPGDAAVIEPVPGTGRGLAIGCGLATAMGDPTTGGDPYLAAIAAIDECVRNLVCVGADPERIAILDNFCWPSCTKPQNLASLVRAAAGCYDGAKAYRTPFVSGKDSLNNQFTIPGQNGKPDTTIEIPPTLLITGIGIVNTLDNCITMDAKRAGNLLVLVGETTATMGGSHYAQLFDLPPAKAQSLTHDMPSFDPTTGAQTARAVAACIAEGLVASAHDCSEGGLAVALAEMLIGSSTNKTTLGAILADHPTTDHPTTDHPATIHPTAWLFAENPGRYVLEVPPAQLEQLRKTLAAHAKDIPVEQLGVLDTSGHLRSKSLGIDTTVADLTTAWRGTLDW
ncbi:MAG: AIR synthase-related protein [Planctomycetota bacterium]|nr:AIR synthase-related protein [Planctomycetota bacterium]